MLNKKNIIYILIILMLIFSFATTISVFKFNTWNPVRSLAGIIRIMLTDSTTVQIQENPRVILAKSDDAWKTFLSILTKDGYKYLENEQMGSICVFEKECIKERIHFL